MSTSVGMTRTGKVTGKSAARHNVIKLFFGPRHAKGSMKTMHYQRSSPQLAI